MVVLKLARTNLALFYCLFNVLPFSKQYEAPKVAIDILEPKGFRASIPDIPNLSLFAFQGNVNRPIARDHVGIIYGEVVEPSEGRWTFEDVEAEFKIGDVINYYFYVSINSTGYLNTNLTYTVPRDPGKLSVLSYKPQVLECKPTLTEVVGGVACAGQVIFADNFDLLREDLWRFEQYIPRDHPEYPFVSYQKHTVSTSDGVLRIIPRLQSQLFGFDNDSIYNGVLNLRNGCTASEELCFLQAFKAEILPPVVTGRLISHSFAFTYGTVHVRARVPQGDWLYPEILLQPLYGLNHTNTGLLKIASARGNNVLHSGSTNYGNTILYGGPILDQQCRDALLNSSSSLSLVKGENNWSEDFHVYSIRWEPDRITLSVDGEEWMHIEPAEEGLWGRLSPACESEPLVGPKGGASIAPFNEPFYLTLGVAAGGTREFKDGITTDHGPKPWSNKEHEASVNFWKNVNSWYPTWKHPELLVDYIKVVAL